MSRVYKKVSTNGKLVLYLINRDLIISKESVSPLHAVVTVDAEELRNKKVSSKSIKSFNTIWADWQTISRWTHSKRQAEEFLSRTFSFSSRLHLPESRNLFSLLTRPTAALVVVVPSFRPWFRGLLCPAIFLMFSFPTRKKKRNQITRRWNRNDRIVKFSCVPPT